MPDKIISSQDDEAVINRIIAQMSQSANQYPDDEIYSVLRFLLSRKHLKGAKILLALISNQDTPVHALNLAAMLDLGITNLMRVPHLGSEFLEPRPIPMTDFETLRICRSQIKKLIKQIADLEAIGMDAEDQRREYRAILSYIKTCTRPGGKIKTFPGIAIRAYYRIRKAMKAIMQEAEACSPEAAYIMQKHLRSGIRFYWQSTAEQKRIEHSRAQNVRTRIAEQTRIEDLRGDNTPRIHKE